MTHDELVDIAIVKDLNKLIRKQMKAINAVFELHEPKFYPAGCKDETCCPEFFACENCGTYYPCPTIQAIEKELK